MKDLINKRSDNGECPICHASTTAEGCAGQFKEVIHQGSKVLICKKHYIQGEKE